MVNLLEWGAGFIPIGAPKPNRDFSGKDFVEKLGQFLNTFADFPSLPVMIASGGY
jgi:hypothetical protein